MGLAGVFWLESWRWVLGARFLRFWVVAVLVGHVFSSRFRLTRWWTQLDQVLCKDFLRRGEVEVCVGKVDAG